jgi:hypothetical protein|tara:strand:+ start:274 stop:501 length:228 start_codon:yes stop_codon:yes gene_type:complete
MNIDLEKVIMSGVGLLLVGMISWLITTVNTMEKEVQLISYKLGEAENELHSIQLTDPSHSSAHCPICLHMKLGYE